MLFAGAAGVSGVWLRDPLGPVGALRLAGPLGGDLGTVGRAGGRS